MSTVHAHKAGRSLRVTEVVTMGKKWQRKIEARIAALENATPTPNELPPAYDLTTLPGQHQPIINTDGPALIGPWYDDDESEDWRPGSRWGFGSYL